MALDHQLDEEQLALVEAVREFTHEVVAPVSARHDREHSFPYEVIAQMGEMGLFGLPFPEEYGGQGGDYFALCLALEELATVDQSVAITLEAGVSLGAMPIFRYGTQEQRQRWLPALTSGEALAGFGLTESGAGSDASGTRTKATRTDQGWLLNGAKEFITNSGTDITSLITVTAVSGEKEDGKKEISTFLVPADTPGFTAEPAYDKVGWNASDTHPVTLKDVRLPEDSLLGEPG
ncbi:MAG TPA: acyl-CoA dehydrogenase family protein, partial [Candidatus Nesterenkonia stercoripullorum]|nr:acyl-CoA dehydrogenase family protein [Candidatus Nesterenkonia stercoripullorum]